MKIRKRVQFKINQLLDRQQDGLMDGLALKVRGRLIDRLRRKLWYQIEDYINKVKKLL